MSQSLHGSRRYPQTVLHVRNYLQQEAAHAAVMLLPTYYGSTGGLETVMEICRSLVCNKITSYIPNKCSQSDKIGT